jgi:hypothetical protein
MCSAAGFHARILPSLPAFTIASAADSTMASSLPDVAVVSTAHLPGSLESACTVHGKHRIRSPVRRCVPAGDRTPANLWPVYNPLVVTIRRRSVLLLFATAILVTGCGDGVAAAHKALGTVTVPPGATVSGSVEPDLGWHYGELLDTGTATTVFVYRPNDAHPSGWLSDNKTVVVRYFVQHGVASTDVVCGLLADWVVANGGTPHDQSCETHAATIHTGMWSDQLPTSDVQVEGHDVALSATIGGSEQGIDIVYWAVAEA